MTFDLDADARKVLDVALGTAAAMADERCGTEYLLFGVIATAQGDMAELAQVFALDTLRVERAIQTLRLERSLFLTDLAADPPLTARARAALSAPALSGADRRSVFDVLVGVISDPTSGAANVLRHLGVGVGEVRRLAEIGAARLGRAEVEGLIAALDRRTTEIRPWWGPQPDAAVVRIALPEGDGVEIARSQSAIARLEGLVAGPDGFGFTLSLTSRSSWVLPPQWEPREELVPGVGARHRLEPDVVVLDLRYPDDTTLSNRRPWPRWAALPPDHGSLIRLGTRSSTESRNDRRIAEQRVDTVDWWMWPLPPEGDVFLDLRWPAEAVTGTVRIDGAAVRRESEALRVCH